MNARKDCFFVAQIGRPATLNCGNNVILLRPLTIGTSEKCGGRPRSGFEHCNGRHECVIKVPADHARSHNCNEEGRVAVFGLFTCEAESSVAGDRVSGETFSRLKPPLHEAPTTTERPSKMQAEPMRPTWEVAQSTPSRNLRSRRMKREVDSGSEENESANRTNDASSETPAGKTR